MGLAPEAFERLTPAEFIYAWLGWAKREGDRQRQAWVATCIQLDRKDRRPMTEVFPLPWETTTPAKQEPTMQERMARIEEMKRCIRK